MATQQEILNTMTALRSLKESNQLNIPEINDHREDFKEFLINKYPVIADLLNNNSTTFGEFIVAASQIAAGVPPEQVHWLPPVQNNIPAQIDHFERYIEKLGGSGEATRSAINATISKINQIFNIPQEDGSARKIISGLVVGKVQSGKTSNYVGLMVKAFQEGWNVVIVLTSNSDLLETQTSSRIQADFEKKADLRTAQLITSNQPPANPHTHYWQVAKKNRAVLNEIYNWLDNASKHKYPDNSCLRDSLHVLIIDDESDNASLNNNPNDRLYNTEELYDKYSELNENQTDETRELTELAASREKYAVYIEKFLDMVDKSTENDDINKHVEELTRRVDPEKQTGKVAEQLDFFMDYCKKYNLPSRDNVYHCTANELQHVFGSKKEWLKILKSIFGVAASATVINRILKKILLKENGFDFAKSAYLGYTATPYANILCESPEETIYPDFIQSIPAGNGYYGADQIFGSYNADLDKDAPENTKARLPIIYHFTKEDDKDINGNDLKEKSDEYQLKLLDVDAESFNLELCPELKKAMAWFCCTAAIRKLNRADAEQTFDRKALWTTMLVNVITRIDEQNTIKKKISEFFKDVLSSEDQRNAYVEYCREIYSELSGNAPSKDFPDNRKMKEYPAFSEFEKVLKKYVLNHKHLKVVALNAANDNADDATSYLNYENCPTPVYNERRTDKEIAWIVVGGHKISRGLTMEGLTASYFKPSDTTAIDTLFQMGRWFGYRDGYELLPRIWMTREIMCKFKRMALYENKLHNSIIDNFNSGNSPKDPEHYQEVYSLAGRLGKRDKFTGRRILRLNMQVPSVAVTTGTLSLKHDDVTNVKDIVTNFFTDNWEGEYGKSNASAHSPIIENVSKGSVIGLLQELRSHYPATSSSKINSLISAINNYDADEQNQELQFNVVLTGISDEAHGGNSIQNYNFANGITITGPERQVSHYQTGQFAAYAAPRAHVANQAFFSEEILASATAAFRRHLEDRGEPIPNNLRANDKFTEYLFGTQECTNPVIQFFVLKPAEELQLNENECLIALSMFWPALRMDKFIRYTCGIPQEELSDEERIDLICNILNQHERAVTYDMIYKELIAIDEMLKGKGVYLRNLLQSAAENNLLKIFVPGQLYGNLQVPDNYVMTLQERIITILENLNVAVKPDKIVGILTFDEEYKNCNKRLVKTICEQYLNETLDNPPRFVQVDGKGPFFGKNGLTERNKSYENMNYSLYDIFCVIKDFICGSPWEVTLDQIKRCLDENNIEFVDNQAISICITQINLQRTFRYCDLEECPFFQVNGTKGLYRSTACQLPDLKTRIQEKIRTILEQNHPVGLEISEIKELVPDQASLSEELLGSNRSRVKTALDELVANGIVRRTERQKPILYYISEVEQ